jgi:tetratricopeptide (TPR) repeat protein
VPFPWLRKLQTLPAPLFYAAALAAILTGMWARAGSFAPPMPQTIADHAYGELTSNPADPGVAVRLFRQALEADTAFPYRWSDLGEALAAAGEMDTARYCFDRSLELDPHSPQISLRAANFAFREGKPDRALKLSNSVLRETAAYDPIIFSSWIRLGGDLRSILQTGIGNNSRAAGEFFRYLARTNDSGRMDETWRWMEGRSFITRTVARDWTSSLITRHREGEAFQVWKRYVAADSDYGVFDWIENGRFETPAGGQGFDWHLDESAGVRVARDASVAHLGHVSLRINFDGTRNVDFHHLFERVWLMPGRYRLTAWLRTSELGPEPGVGLSLFGDSTETLVGQNDWNQLKADITVSPGSPLGQVTVIRHPSVNFDGKLRGTAWITEVELRRIQ